MLKPTIYENVGFHELGKMNGMPLAAWNSLDKNKKRKHQKIWDRFPAFLELFEKIDIYVCMLSTEL